MGGGGGKLSGALVTQDLRDASLGGLFGCSFVFFFLLLLGPLCGSNSLDNVHTAPRRMTYVYDICV